MKRIVVYDYIAGEMPSTSTIGEWKEVFSKYNDDTDIRIYETGFGRIEYAIPLTRLETDSEYELRVKREKFHEKARKENEYEQYLVLKEKFENDKTDSTV